MPREKSLPIVYSTLVFLLSACATAANGNPKDVKETKLHGVQQFANDPRLGEQVSRMCFVSSIDGFSDATDDTVVLEVSPKKNYLVEVSRSCSRLDSAQSIAVKAASSCATKGDRLLVSDSAFGLKQASGFGPDSCMITGIYEWNEDAGKKEADDKDS